MEELMTTLRIKRYVVPKSVKLLTDKYCYIISAINHVLVKIERYAPLLLFARCYNRELLPPNLTIMA